MRLAILGSRGYPSTYGGYETLVRYLASDWVDRGHEVTVYCRTRPKGSRVWWVDGVRCIWTPGRESKALSTLSFGASAHLDAAFRAYDGALVLNVANGFYLPWLRAARVPTVVNTDGVEWERGKWGTTAQRVFYQGAALTAHYGDVLVADSEAIGRIWKQLFDVESVFIPYGAPVVEHAGTERIHAMGLGERSYALVVARLIPENNVDLVLDALDRMPDRCKAVIVGSANYRSPLERRLRELDDHGTVRWLGHVADQQLLVELWANCAVYVHGHSVGGTNPGLLQALGAGAPTLALDTVFNREVLACDTQLFPKNAAELERRMTDLVAAPVLRERLAARGRKVVAERYRWADVCHAYLGALAMARERTGDGRWARALRGRQRR